jgi:phage N-6-adenine-methyltransferase
MNNGKPFDLDAAGSVTNKRAMRVFTKQTSALEHEWITKAQAGSFVWLNPPYSQIKAFVRRTAEQVKRYNYTVPMLVPARTDTEWFHEACSTAQNIYFIKGRLHFVSEDGIPSEDGAGFPSCLIIWGGSLNGRTKAKHPIRFSPLVLTAEERGKPCK